MMEKCPNCRVENIGLTSIFFTNYFQPYQCPHCKNNIYIKPIYQTSFLLIVGAFFWISVLFIYVMNWSYTWLLLAISLSLFFSFKITFSRSGWIAVKP